MTTLQTYIYKLRKEVLDPYIQGRLQTKQYGYLLEVPDENVDSCHFERLSSEGRAALDKGDPLRASELLSEALSLWSGQALIGVTVGEILSAYVTRMEENKLRTLEMHIDADMRLGRHNELISELKTLTSAYPLHERFYGDLMTALNRAGRRYEALQAYRRLRTVLIDELGLEPSAPLQRLHESLLNGDLPDHAPYPRRAPGPAPASRPAPVTPAQLPPDIPDFTGRADSLKLVRAGITSGDRETTVRTLAVCGMPGVGKTALALHAAHLDRARFPDGQFYAGLRGSSAHPVSPADVLADFLRAAGVPAAQVPGSLEERAKLFRSWTSGRRVLVLLDDADSVAQVEPLFPADPLCSVIITSRSGMQALPGVQVVELGLMDYGESTEFLRRVVGQSRAAAEWEEAEKIVELCGHLPLALRCVCTRLTAMRNWPLRKMAATLQSRNAPLDAFRFAAFDVRASYDGTYFRLDPDDRSILRLLSLLPSRDFPARTAADLIGATVGAVESRLAKLVDCHLLEVTTKDGIEEERYQLHELTRLYARERLDRELMRPQDASTEQEREPGEYRPDQPQ